MIAVTIAPHDEVAAIQSENSTGLIELLNSFRCSGRSSGEAMDIQGIINELKSSLEHSFAEENLLETITNELALLRQYYLSDKNSFTVDHIAFLKSLTPVTDHLRTFVEMKEELSSVNSLKHYSFLMNQLTDLKSALEPFAVRKRVGKEIRELMEKLPQIRQRDEANEQSRINARIVDLEQQVPHCVYKHRMVIREGRYGYFWGCSRYPVCEEMKPLSPQEKDYLYS